MRVTFNQLKNLTNASIAREIIMQYFGWNLLEYSLKSDEKLDEKEREILINIAKRYANNEPLQYIFKKTQINNMEFFCEEGVLIPREDTLVLINEAIKFLKQSNCKNILEIGTGSGLISVFLAREFGEKCMITACDINEKAIALAKKNAEFHNVKCDFVLNDFKNLDFTKFDFVISNPPYICNDYKLDEKVLKEPDNALFGGEIGDEILCEIIQKCAKNNIRALACEFGYDQKLSMQKELDKFSYKYDFFTDLSGFDRAFVAWK